MKISKTQAEVIRTQGRVSQEVLIIFYDVSNYFFVANVSSTYIVYLTLRYSLHLTGESGIDVALDVSEKIAGAVAPTVMGPVKGTILSTGIKKVRGFVDRIQKGNSNENNDGIHTNRSFDKYSYKLPTYLHVVKTIRNNTIYKSILLLISDFHPDGRMRLYCTLTFVWNTWKL